MDTDNLAEELKHYDYDFDSWDTDRKIPKELFDRILAALSPASNEAVEELIERARDAADRAKYEF